VRKRFLVTYQTAATPEVKSDAVKMLKGLTSQESRRLLAGMLGDQNEAVRVTACQTMAMTPDDDGYFVKPLMGALTDGSDFVRIAAADALGSEHVRADAVKALAYALVVAAGTVTGADNEKERNTGLVIRAYNGALERLTSHHTKDTDARSISAYWMDFWKQNEDDLRTRDKELRGSDNEPVRPAGLEPDTFDKQDKQKEKPKK
jgi:hypothetical protein